MKIIHSFFIMVFLVSCQERNQKEIDLSGNWQSLSDGVDDIYTEFYFHDDTLERFNVDWGLLPYSKFEIRGDSLLTKIHYKIQLEDERSINLISETDTIQLIKLITENRTIEDLLNEGYFDKDLSDSIHRKELELFVNESFRIRELQLKFDKGILNKDSLLYFWKSQLETDKDFYLPLVEEFVDK